MEEIIKRMAEAHKEAQKETDPQKRIELDIRYLEIEIEYYQHEECGTAERYRAKHIGQKRKMIERRQEKLKEMKGSK